MRRLAPGRERHHLRWDLYQEHDRLRDQGWSTRMVILYCGELGKGGTCRMRMEALRNCGHTVVGIDTSYALSGPARLAARVIYKLGYAVDATKLNETLLNSVVRQDPDILWIDKGLADKPSTLRAIRSSHPNTKLVHYSPDDIAASHK